jgi:MFS family permease
MSLPSQEDAQPQGLVHAFRAFRHRDFALFWCGALVSNVGAWLASLTIPYVVYQVTGSALLVGLVAVFQFVPFLLSGPWGGVLADRHDRRRILLITQTGLMLSAFLVWAVVAAGVREPLVIMGAVSLTGIFAGLNMPSWQAFVNDLVPREDLQSAVALNSFQFNASRALGPAIAGILIALVGPSWALLYNALSYTAVLLALALIRVRPVATASPDRTRVHAQLRTAVRYVRTQPGIAVSILVSFIVGVLVNPLFQLTVVFAGSVFDVGPVRLGLMNAAMGLGALLAIPFIAGWAQALSLARIVRVALFVLPFGIAGFALSPTWAIALVPLTVVGACFLALMSSCNTAMQLIVTPLLRGRVISVRIMIYTLATPIGSIIQGSLADSIGPRWTVLGAAALMLAASAALTLTRGRLQISRLDDPHDAGS